MSQVIFIFKGGRTRKVSQAEARLLTRLGKGSVAVADAAAEAGGAPPVDVAAVVAAGSAGAELPAPEEAGQTAIASAPAAVDIDSMDADALRALAQERGVKVHHNAGVDKIREALREASK